MSESESEGLRAGEQGPFAELARKANPNALVLVYIPALAALLERARQLKGQDLSPVEVARIGEKARAVAMTQDMAREVWEQRGGMK